MADALAHRGPDGSGVWTAPGIGLGHRRLSIIDLATGDQPMRSPDGRIALSYNGEIYNFREVTGGARGQRPCSSGRRATPRWCSPAGGNGGRTASAASTACSPSPSTTPARTCLFLARDRLGVKPLYLATLPDGALVFASELKGLLAHPLLRRTPEPAGARGLSRFRLRPRRCCMVEGVGQARRRPLPAGPARRPDPAAGQMVGRRLLQPVDRRVEKALEEELVERLQSAVRSRMVADVPLGAFLSGGVDSSAVVALMAEASRSAVETCSIGFAEADHDETQWAALVAARFATSHRSRIVAAEDFGLIDTLADAFDEPFADASALATYRVCGAGPRDGQGRLVRRRRRRGLCRLPPLPDVRRRGAGAGAASGRGARRCSARSATSIPSSTGRPASCAPRRPCRRSAGTAAKPMPTPSAVTAQPIRSRIYREDFKRLLQGHRAENRYVEAMAEAPAARRSVARPICRPQDLAARRHPHQGRPDQHGGQPRGARAFARPSPRRVRRAACRRGCG